MIFKPGHFMNGSSSCIDLIFCSNVNLKKNCGVEHLLYEKCHRNIIYESLNFNIYLPLPFYRSVWDFQNAKIEYIQKIKKSIYSKNQYQNLTGQGFPQFQRKL